MGIISARTILYIVLSILLSLPAFIESYLRSSGNMTLGVVWVVTLALLWSSWPRYRSRFLRVATYGLSAIVVGNLLASIAIVILVGDTSPTLAPNLNVHVHFVGAGVPPGITPDQTVTTNAHGHRTNGPIDYWHKPTGALRLVAIGASTTEETKLNDHQTWTYMVGQALEAATKHKVEVINTALSGVRAENNYWALREALAYHPDIVTFLMGINDWNYVISRQHWSSAHRLLAKFSPLTFGNSPLYRELKEVYAAIQLWRHPVGNSESTTTLEDDGAYTASSVRSLERPNKMSFHPTTVDADYADWVGGIFDECKKNHIFCLFMDQPTAYSETASAELRARLWMTPPFADYTLSMADMINLSRVYNDWMAQAVKSNGLTFCPLAAKVPATLDYLIDDCHFNENGARRVAEVVTACLLENRSQFEGH